MKKEFSITDLAGEFNEQYMLACGNLSWYDFIAGMPSLVFVVTGWKSNGKENACLHSWSSFAAVSYTHLDVYKRQGQNRCGRFLP